MFSKRRSAGRLFHTTGLWTAKLQSPYIGLSSYVEQWVGRTRQSAVDTDRRVTTYGWLAVCRRVWRSLEPCHADCIPARTMPLHWLSLRCFWSNLVTSVDLQLPALVIHLHQECDTNLSFPHLQDFLNILAYSFQMHQTLYSSFISWVSARNQNNYILIAISAITCTFCRLKVLR